MGWNTAVSSQTKDVHLQDKSIATHNNLTNAWKPCKTFISFIQSKQQKDPEIHCLNNFIIFVLIKNTWHQGTFFMIKVRKTDFIWTIKIQGKYAITISNRFVLNFIMYCEIISTKLPCSLQYHITVNSGKLNNQLSVL